MSANPPTDQKAHPVWGWLCTGIGSYILLAAMGALPLNPESLHVPRAIFALCGIVFLLCGMMTFIGLKSKFNALAAAVLCLCFALIAGWIAVFAQPDGISGGIPYLPSWINEIMCRTLLGIGAFLCLGISAYAFTRFLKGSSQSL